MLKFLRAGICSALLLTILQGCGGCSAPGPNEACEPDQAEACGEHDFALSCLPVQDGSYACLNPLGGRCDLSDDYCAPGAECQPDAEGTARCLLTESAACDMDEDFCAGGLVCAAVGDDEYQCHPHVFVQGVVFDSENLDPIEGAHIIAFNEEGSALSDVAVSDANGIYTLSLPAVRDEEGSPIQQFFTLRVGAANYQTFPSGIRQAQPIDASQANDLEEGYVIDTAQTDVALIPLPEEEQGFPSIRGRVDIEGGLGGVLVVAEADADTGFSAVSARDGAFAIFNVPPGEYEVRGYIADYQIEPTAVSMDDERIVDVILTRSEAGIKDLAGQIQIVSAHGSLRSSVVLVVASTFDEISVRGEVPAGLRAPRTGTPNINGEWTIEGVPAGDYYVLAGFENDQLVRDPDEGTAGTDLVRITVPAEGGTMNVTPSFKVTAALDTVSPGREGPEGLTERPTLTWGPYSNAQWYDLVVFDAFGNVVWEANAIPPAGGSANLSVLYEGPFEEGMYYQFRAIAFRMSSAISSTEPLRGVFFRQ